MKRPERLEIGKLIYEKKLSKEAASEKYGINLYTARNYLREYKASIEEPRGQIAQGYGYYYKSKEALIEEICEFKCAALLKEGMKPVEVIYALRKDFPVQMLCKSCRVSKCWYYRWVKKQYKE